MKRAPCLIFALTTAFAQVSPTTPPSAPAKREVTSVTNQMLAKPDPADWLMWRRTLDSWGYSPLNQITRANVGNLKLVWTRGMTEGTQEGTPLVHDGVMFLPNPGDLIQALDAATGDLLWDFKRQFPEGFRQGNGNTTRTLALSGKSIIDLSADDFVYAVDVETGKLQWETRVLDYREDSGTQSGGPIVAGGKIFSTRACRFNNASPNGCVITAHDAATGKELWRRRTIPRPGEPGDETWGAVAEKDRRHVGAWMTPSFDAELNLLYVGTSVTSPAPKYMLDGNDKQYLYHNSTLALNANTGEIVWYYQHVVDHWDLDHPFERLLIDTAVAPDPSQVTWINPKLKPGERRKVLTGIPGKTGIVYTLDRATGEFLWARPTVFQNVVSKIDGASGAVTVNPATLFTEDGQTRRVCPGTNGGKDFPAGAYSPLTNTMYYGLQNACMDVTSIANRNTAYAFNAKALIAPGTDNVGSLFAISAETGKTLWRYDQRAGMMSSVATGGGLIFTGDAAGHFRAFDQQNGKVLWDVNLGSEVSGYPITFSVKGKQYVAVSTGSSLVSGAMNTLTGQKATKVNAVYVFALP
jgi:PQQ-dependent dehydrogenase (methanol/ethanol family)